MEPSDFVSVSMSMSVSVSVSLRLYVRVCRNSQGVDVFVGVVCLQSLPLFSTIFKENNSRGEV